MHTNAHSGAAATPLMQYSGTLTHQAEARMRPLDGEGHYVAVLCLDVELDNAAHTPLHVEQPFASGSIEQARAAAHRLKKGMRITVQAPLAAMRLVAANAAHIHVINPQEEATCPK